MFLEYGVKENGELIRIDQVARGRLTGVSCPYCHRPLLARKGKIKASHFAHDGETCRAASRDTDAISLPAYDRFHLNLSGRDFALYQRAAEFVLHQTGGGVTTAQFEYLESLGLVTFNRFAAGGHGAWELTHLGKIPVGELSLMLFNQVQAPLIVERYAALENAAYRALGTVDFETALTDLRLYRAQWQRILTLTLYFMEITHTGGVLHKIGVTNRSAEERAIEIAADLRPHLGDVSIKVIDTWPHRGNVERYFKHRYAASQHRLGDLTEYFAFDDPKTVLGDLRRMKPKRLDAFEQEILAGLPCLLERGEPPPDHVLSLETWLLLEQLTTGQRKYHDVPSRYKLFEQLRHERLSSFQPARNMDEAVHQGITDRGMRYFQYFSGFYHQRYAAHYEAQRLAARAAQKRAAIQEGMKRAAAGGKHVGRPAEAMETYLQKPQAQAIRAALERGSSLRETARETGAAINTIRKVKALLEVENADT